MVCLIATEVQTLFLQGQPDAFCGPTSTCKICWCGLLDA